MPLTWYNSPDSKITNVVIIDGKYDRIDEFSFYMYIICSVTFYYEGIFQQQCYCVNGYCNIAEKSDFLCDVSIYDGKRFRLKNPLNEFLVPILPKKRYDETALQILSNYYPFRYDIPCVISGLALAKEMGYHIQYARLSLDGKVKSKVIFEEKNITAFDEYGGKTAIYVSAKTILVDKSIKGKENFAVIHECVCLSSRKCIKGARKSA